MRKLRGIVLAGAVVLSVRTGKADTYIGSDTTIDASFAAVNMVWIGYATEYDATYGKNPTSPTVTAVDGAGVGAPIDVFNNSTFNIKGGYIDFAEATNTSTINLTGGELVVASANANGTIKISGGYTNYGLHLFDNSTVIMSGGEVGKAALSGQGVTGENDVTLWVASTALLNGGIIDGGVTANDRSTVDANQMTILGGVQVDSLAHATIGGSTIGGVGCSGTCDVNDSTVTGTITAQNAGVVTVSGGSAASITANYLGTIRLDATPIAGDLYSYYGNIQVNGGSVGGNVTAVGGVMPGLIADITLDGGVTVAGSVTGHNSAAIAVYSATVAGRVESHENSAVASAGTIQAAAAYDQSVLFLTGGSATDAYAYNSSQLQVDGGTITGTLSSSGDQYGSNQVGGAFAGQVGVFIISGTIANLAAPSGNVVMNGGTVQHDYLQDGGTTYLNGGSINGTATVNHNATLYLSGGTVTNIVGNDQSAIFITSGTVNGSIQIHASIYNSLEMSGGRSFGGLISDGASTVLLDGGRVGGDAQLEGGTSLTMSSGSVGGSMIASENSYLILTGGTVEKNAVAHDHVTMALEGVTVNGDLIGDGNSTIFLESGTIEGNAHITGQSVFDWTGGKVVGLAFNTSQPHEANGLVADALVTPADDPLPSGIFLDDQASLEIDGGGLTAVVIDSNYGGEFTEYRLTGTLADGTQLPDDLYLFMENGSGATFSLVNLPEPGGVFAWGVVIMGVGSIGGRRMRRVG